MRKQQTAHKNSSADIILKSATHTDNEIRAQIMKILVTGARGFVGRNLCAQLNNIREGKARCYGDLKVSEVYEGQGWVLR